MYLQWTDLVTGYHKSEPLHRPFSGEVRKSGIYAILGPNGCGKSTLMKTWIGLMKPLRGGAHVNKAPVQDVLSIGQGIGYVPQFHRVNKFFQLTVEDFVRQGFGPSYKDTPERHARVKELLEAWQLDTAARRSFHELSQGQKTRAMVVRSILVPPKLLFLDEPLASLDPCCQASLMGELRSLVEERGICVFMVEHHLENFESHIAGRVVFERTHDQAICAINTDF